MRTYVVDTHALVWFIGRDQRLSDTARAILRNPNARIIIPIIVLVEIKYLSHKGRFAQTLDEVLRVIDRDSRCTIYPIDMNVVDKAPLDLNIHDSLIVGTALAQQETVTGVLTRDDVIISSGLVPTVW
jgi:PIN domain nuclease of toxin-antitoxin system